MCKFFLYRRPDLSGIESIIVMEAKVSSLTVPRDLTNKALLEKSFISLFHFLSFHYAQVLLSVII